MAADTAVVDIPIDISNAGIFKSTIANISDINPDIDNSEHPAPVPLDGLATGMQGNAQNESDIIISVNPPPDLPTDQRRNSASSAESTNSGSDTDALSIISQETEISRVGDLTPLKVDVDVQDFQMVREGSQDSESSQRQKVSAGQAPTDANPSSADKDSSPQLYQTVMIMGSDSQTPLDTSLLEQETPGPTLRADDDSEIPEASPIAEQAKEDVEGDTIETTSELTIYSTGSSIDPVREDNINITEKIENADNQTVKPGSIPDPAPVQFVPPHKPFKPKRSASAEEWERLKDKEGVQNEALDSLMALTGLEQVKDQFLAMLAKAEVCAKQGINLRNERFHAVFQGNPGTGKTTVARIYARFLRLIGKLQSNEVIETSGAKIAYGGPGLVEKMIQNLLKKGGGVLFVDEAYQLTADHSSIMGRQALDILLTEIENELADLVVVFVGYNKEMESFFEHNPGLASRISYNLQFADFEDWELHCIMKRKIQDIYRGKMKIEGTEDGLYMQVCIRRLARQRGFKGFGNARAVATTLQWITDRQSRRLATAKRNGQPGLDYFLFSQADLLGNPPSTVWTSDAWLKLKKMIGLASVKHTAQKFITTIERNYKREMLELEPLKFSLNRIFVGNPGTGKTTVAKLYGQIMADLGFLSNGEVVLKAAADFIGACLGKSEAQTKAILNTTLGKVLIIDEAYMFYNGESDKQDQYRTAVIDTLVAEVQSVPGDNRCVLLLGYEDKMRDMFLKVNPGLARRFQVDDPFKFEDYNVEELMKILELKMEEQDLILADSARPVACDLLRLSHMRPSFSNAGEVDMLLSRAKMNWQERIQKLTDDEAVNKPVLSVDFDPDHTRIDSQDSVKSVLQGQVADEIIKQLDSLRKKAQNARLRGSDPRKAVPMNFVFRGYPGTGKTTTARHMGTIFHSMGILSTPEVIECSASELVGQYVGQTGPKTRTQLERGLGKVLFIDEAYRLAHGQYATEACNEMIYQLSQPKFKGRMIIILAGYTRDMDDLMRLRPGFVAHFTGFIHFPNISSDHCISLLEKELMAREAPIGPGFAQNQAYMKKLFTLLKVFPTWANANSIKTLAERIYGTFLDKVTDPTDLEKSGQINTAGCTKNSVSVGELQWEDILRCIMAEVHYHRRMNCKNIDPNEGYGDIPGSSSTHAESAQNPAYNTNTPAEAHQTDISAPVDTSIAIDSQAAPSRKSPLPQPQPFLTSESKTSETGNEAGIFGPRDPGMETPGAVQEAEQENQPHCTRVEVSTPDNQHGLGAGENSNQQDVSLIQQPGSLEGTHAVLVGQHSPMISIRVTETPSLPETEQANTSRDIEADTSSDGSASIPIEVTEAPSLLEHEHPRISQDVDALSVHSEGRPRTRRRDKVKRLITRSLSRGRSQSTSDIQLGDIRNTGETADTASDTQSQMSHKSKTDQPGWLQKLGVPKLLSKSRGDERQEEDIDQEEQDDGTCEMGYPWVRQADGTYKCTGGVIHDRGRCII